MKLTTYLFFLLLSFSSCGQKSLQEIVKESRIPKSELLILIDKSDYTLSVLHKEKKLITYPCVFGFDPVNDKSREGDGCTPEGKFKIRSMYAHKSWSYFIWIDYPNASSWEKFKRRKAEGKIPKDATIGGEVGIHGVPDGMDELIDQKSNWTLGCISLKEKDITDLYKSIGSSTMIKIQP